MLIPFGLFLYAAGAYLYLSSRVADQLAECESSADVRAVVLPLVFAPFTVATRGMWVFLRPKFFS